MHKMFLITEVTNYDVTSDIINIVKLTRPRVKCSKTKNKTLRFETQESSIQRSRTRLRGLRPRVTGSKIKTETLRFSTKTRGIQDQDRDSVV